MTEHEAWLALTKEDAIDPDLPICDAHHHLWDRPGDRYLVKELLQDIGRGHHVIQTVFVDGRAMYRKDQPMEMQPVGETDFIGGLAERNASKKGVVTDVAAGIVSFVELRLGAAVAPVLEAHIEACRKRFRGVRYNSNWDASPDVPIHRNPPKGLLLDAKFREGFACLHKLGLSFDAFLYHPQLPELVDLARAFPDTTIVLNHIGCPLGIGPYTGKRDEVFRKWKQGIVALAACPNVVVKLGGMGLTYFGFGWHERAAPPGSTELAKAIAPYFNLCIEQFGVERCMFESDFPVDKISYSYTVLWNAFKLATRDFSPLERAALFHGTAQRVYRLPSNHTPQ